MKREKPLWTDRWAERRQGSEEKDLIDIFTFLVEITVFLILNTKFKFSDRDVRLIMVDQTQAFILAPSQNPNKMSTNEMPKRCFKRLKPVR